MKIDDNTNLTLTIFDQTIKNLLITIGKKDVPQTEENITQVFLDLPLVEITYIVLRYNYTWSLEARYNMNNWQ